ncbi:daptide biosynthesis RiPP recognition protein [Clavibacter michiganensis]|nr:daptide biosynthesis RiPP recognition protein [Clavibacter michiganensis]
MKGKENVSDTPGAVDAMRNSIGSDPAVSVARATSSAIHQWATGVQSVETSRVILFQGSDLDRQADRLSRTGDVILAPVASGSPGRRLPSGASVLTYEGQLVDAGDVMHIGRGYEIEFQDYLAVPFSPINRPTVVRLSSAEDWKALAADADEAQATGSFITQMTSASVVLADRSVIDAVAERVDIPVNRLTVDHVGDVRYWPHEPSPEGAAVNEAMPTAAYFAAIGGEATERLVRERPWFQRYLAALRVIGQEGGGAWSISGFGRTLGGSAPHPGSRTTGELLIWREDEHLLVEPDSGRRFKLGRETAIAVEALLEADTLDAAVDRGASAGLARRGLHQRITDLQGRLADVGVAIGPEAAAV